EVTPVGDMRLRIDERPVNVLVDHVFEDVAQDHGVERLFRERERIAAIGDQMSNVVVTAWVNWIDIYIHGSTSREAGSILVGTYVEHAPIPVPDLEIVLAAPSRVGQRLVLIRDYPPVEPLSGVLHHRGSKALLLLVVPGKPNQFPHVPSPDERIFLRIPQNERPITHVVRKSPDRVCDWNRPKGLGLHATDARGLGKMRRVTPDPRSQVLAPKIALPKTAQVVEPHFTHQSVAFLADPGSSDLVHLFHVVPAVTGRERQARFKFTCSFHDLQKSQQSPIWTGRVDDLERVALNFASSERHVGDLVCLDPVGTEDNPFFAFRPML